jgi:hypothetical protein
MAKFISRSVLVGTIALFAGSLLAADAKDDVKAAAKKLGDQANYSWKTTVENAGGGGGGGRFRQGPTEGKAEKDGFICLALTRGENVTTEAVLKGAKGAIKLEDGWKSLEEAAQDDGSGQPNPGRFIGRMLQTFKAPAAQADDLVGKVKEIKKADDAYAGDLTEDGAKSLLTFGPRGGNNGPEISDARGSAKFWIKDGVLAKYEFNVQGKISFNGNDREVNRTTTVNIKDVGSTKVEVPEEAKKKAS